MIHTIVFDIGNVLTGYDPAGCVRRHFQDEEVVRRVIHVVWESGCWGDLDRGEDEAAVMARMLETEPAYAEEIRTMVEHAGDTITRHAYGIPWIRPAVFLDDGEENLKGTEAFGMKTIRFRSYEQADAELSALLLEEGKRCQVP